MDLSLARMTSAEFRALQLQRPVLLLPMGSLEAQGPQAPMGDFLLCERIAALIAERAQAAGHETRVLPVLPFGGADYFGCVPGGIALGQGTLRAVLRDILEALARHDLTRVVIVNGHGGNAQAIHDETLALRRRTGAIVPSLSIWRIAGAWLTKMLGAEEAARRRGHGADPLGSVACHLLPELMRPELLPASPARGAEVLGLQASGFATARFADAEIDLPMELDEIAPDGLAGGDARLCSAETGAALTERLVELGAGLIAHLCAQDWGARAQTTAR